MIKSSSTDYINQRKQAFLENYKEINEKILAAAQKAGRNPEEIRLLAATKTVEAEVINFAIENGIGLIGENRVQEFMDKYDELILSERHFIGRLQTNKVKYIAGKVSLVHSVDSVKLAKEIGAQSKKLGITTPILIEINVGGEESKGGVIPEAAGEFISEISEIGSIRVEGLMSIPPICDSNAQISAYFEKMHKLFIDIGAQKVDNINMSILSMGMSDDYEAAIAHGATLIRLGTALFGGRPPRI